MKAARVSSIARAAVLECQPPMVDEPDQNAPRTPGAAPEQGQAAHSQELLTLPPGRARAAWQAWLRALADDAEAALAAALTYEALGPAERDGWLDALDEDATEVLAP